MTPKIKICGLMGPADVEAVNEGKADYAGFVFYGKSRRCLTEEQANALLRRLDKCILSVAVCVSPTKEDMKRYEEMGFSVIQIHGVLSEDVLGTGTIPVWQAANLGGNAAESGFVSHPRMQGYVLDGASYGGGRTFGWERDPRAGMQIGRQVRNRIGAGRLILAGGLTADNVCDGIELFAPDIVDVSSGVETDGRKDREKILEFIRRVRAGKRWPNKA